MRHLHTDSDHDDVQFLTERSTAWPRRARDGSTSTLCSSPAPAFQEIRDEVIDLTADLGMVGHGLLREGEFALETLRVSDSVIKPGMFLEVRQFLVGEYQVDFMLVRIITRCRSTGKVNIRGVPFSRTRSVLNKLPKKANEVCMILYFEDGDSSKPEELVDVCAGGVSRGAQMAGFKVEYAVDKAEEVWDTYKTNFPDTQLFKMSLDEFLSDPGNGHLRVDVLHFSPPCQYFSPAHTWAAAHDDENIFALFSCNQLLKKTRPRIITVEQTFGLTHSRHAEYCRAFLGDFTQFGYSVRWKVVRLCTWGAAQDRKRLIIIAAAPGERLPPFPAATHSQDGEGGLLPYNSIQRALGGVRRGDDLHDLQNVKYYQTRRPSYDPRRLAGTITTGGNEVYFPDGTRDLTLRELASLQGFPKNHTFLGTKTSIKRQIGNAFPPNTVRVLYRHIEEWLLKNDGMQPYQLREELVVVDDESDESDESMDIRENSENRQASPEMDEDLMEIPNGNSDDPVEVDQDSDCMIIDLT
ncbi:hypothetical protein G7Z17_g7246 [Cylindrodendrum hubeiense]|uniref:DNA (cytosine-5-)-methyltransferase n=1 Tax=Cylindrodendrum hubeiense TaxID=595255 RepID=A0A9P5LA33_9HYPO|nr:hypothetical protein G7Z17_g7246 [Cylindrodendrum hubeiense]